MGFPGIDIKLIIEKLLVFFRHTDLFVKEHKHLVPISCELSLSVFSFGSFRLINSANYLQGKPSSMLSRG